MYYLLTTSQADFLARLGYTPCDHDALRATRHSPRSAQTERIGHAFAERGKVTLISDRPQPVLLCGSADPHHDADPLMAGAVPSVRADSEMIHSSPQADPRRPAC